MVELIEKSPGLVPENVTGLNVRLVDPVFVRVAVWEALDETATAPKANGDGVRLTMGTPAEEKT